MNIIQLKTKRTLGIWLFGAFYSLQAIVTVWNIARLMHLFGPRVLLLLSLNLYLAGGVIAGNLTGAIYLFALRKVSFFIFLGTFLVGIIYSSYSVVSTGSFAALGYHVGIQDALFIWGVQVAACIYVRSLSRAGVLE